MILRRASVHTALAPADKRSNGCPVSPFSSLSLLRRRRTARSIPSVGSGQLPCCPQPTGEGGMLARQPCCCGALSVLHCWHRYLHLHIDKHNLWGIWAEMTKPWSVLLFIILGWRSETGCSGHKISALQYHRRKVVNVQDSLSCFSNALQIWGSHSQRIIQPTPSSYILAIARKPP